MSGTRAGSPTVTDPVADDRIPFPTASSPLACQASPRLFAIEDVTGTARPAALNLAKRACGACPIAAGCLKWALANPHLTPTGVWAATTHRDRNRLRRSLRKRLGADWIGVVAEQDRRRQAKQRAARHAPPTVREAVMARLELLRARHRPLRQAPRPQGWLHRPRSLPGDVQRPRSRRRTPRPAHARGVHPDRPPQPPQGGPGPPRRVKDESN